MTQLTYDHDVVYKSFTRWLFQHSDTNNINHFIRPTSMLGCRQVWHIFIDNIKYEYKD